ncbi:MAG TPA: hypothetical protein VHW23_04610 [Kofleriaceae bacterium]|jgi:hypothetical protein|nr:hypothetical protein [Kofleriaceae bacterium]
MLRDAVEQTEIEIGAVVSWGAEPQRESELDWHVVDRALRTIRQRRATLDAEEARWLREARHRRPRGRTDPKFGACGVRSGQSGKGPRIRKSTDHGSFARGLTT